MCMSCQLQQLLQTSNRFIHKTMSIGIGDNFNYQGSKFNMDRDSFQTKEAMKNYPETSLPPKGFRTYCAEDDEYYEFNAGNSVDPDTGKWRMVDNPTAKKTVEDAKTNGDYAKEQGDAAKEAARKVTNDVLFKVFQSLTEEEQTQVKQNIGIGVEQKFQGQFESYSELEGVSSPAVGDYAYVGNPRNLYAYKSSGWVNLGEFNYNIDQELDADSERGIANGVVTKTVNNISDEIAYNQRAQTEIYYHQIRARKAYVEVDSVTFEDGFFYSKADGSKTENETLSIAKVSVPAGSKMILVENSAVVVNGYIEALFFNSSEEIIGQKLLSGELSEKDKNVHNFHTIIPYETSSVAFNVRILNKDILLIHFDDFKNHPDIIVTAEHVEGLNNISGLEDSVEKSTNLANPDNWVKGYYDSGQKKTEDSSYNYILLDVSDYPIGTKFSLLDTNSIRREMRFAGFYAANETVTENIFSQRLQEITKTEESQVTLSVTSMVSNENVGIFAGDSPKYEDYYYNVETIAKWENKSSNEKGLIRVKDLDEAISPINKEIYGNFSYITTSQAGFLTSNGTYSSEGQYHSITTNKIPCQEGQQFSYNGQGRSAAMSWLLYKDDTITGTGQYSGLTTVTIPAEVNYIVFSSFDFKETEVKLEVKDVSSTNIINRLNQLEEKATQIGGGNILSGKKWAVCGDSFSAGDFTGYEGDDTTISEGIYAGQKKLYGWIIGNRNGMAIQHMALGGRTMAYPADGSFANAFSNAGNTASNSNYTQIDEDVDYVTLYFGINDSHHRKDSTGSDGEDQTGIIEIGTIDDTDNTTFYGAWNVVLKWVIENRPFAKIGILVSNGCETDDYRLATIAVANKWGIPYIDLNGDERTPMMLRSTNPNVTSAAKSARMSAQRCTETNGHPNPKAHEYESTFIENFLRTL